MDWIAVHEHAAAEYETLANEAKSPQMKQIYEGLAAHRRKQAEFERAKLQAQSENAEAIATVSETVSATPEYEPLDEYKTNDWI